jgi:hypothetical protein
MTEADKKILGTDYSKERVSRSEAELYPLLQRGSARLINDLYRTENEQDKFINDGVALRLPGRRGILDRLPRSIRFLRSLFVKLR